MDKIEHIGAYHYHWKAREARGDKMNNGLLAQEVEVQFPELVQNDSEGIKSVSYIYMVAGLLQAIYDQQFPIKRLQEEVRLLK